MHTIYIYFVFVSQEAYALWACAAVLPHWTQGHRYRVKACGSVCLEAEQQCPWLLPVADDLNPYAGEAAFTCIGTQTSVFLSFPSTLPPSITFIHK